MLRVHWLSFHLAVCHMRRVDDRLLLVLWHFADRWGRVTPSGVSIDIPLTHRLLALVVGARRPFVTAAVRDLIQAPPDRAPTRLSVGSAGGPAGGAPPTPRLCRPTRGRGTDGDTGGRADVIWLPRESPGS